MNGKNVLAPLALWCLLLLILGGVLAYFHARTTGATEQPPRPAQIRHVVLSTARTADLIRVGNAQNDVLDGDMLSGYVMATFDQMSIDGRICPPVGTDTGQVLIVGKRAIMAATADQPATTLGTAMRKAYPCARRAD